MKEFVFRAVMEERIDRLRSAKRTMFRSVIWMLFAFIMLNVSVMGVTGDGMATRISIPVEVVFGAGIGVMWCAYMQLGQSLELHEFLSRVIGKPEQEGEIRTDDSSSPPDVAFPGKP